VSLTGGGQTLLTPEACDHQLVEPQPAFFRLVFARDKQPVHSISPDGRFCVDHMSTVSDPPVIVLRDLDDDGRVVAELERTDITKLLEAGFVLPEQFCVRSEDGTVDLWGTLTLPADPVDPTSIPVIDLMYAGFQTTWQPSGFLGPDLGGRSTSPGAAYGVLGLATVVVDGRGTPGRSRAFRQHTQGEPDPTLGLADHVWAIQQLGKSHPQLDTTRVGVTGFSYGGYNSTRSMLVFPDFFKVAVSGAGVHVPEKMPHGAWSWHVGLDVDKTSDLYKQLGNTQLVENLKGKLLLTYGDMDENATPDHTLALIAALVAAGKRFDVKVWPGGNHYTQGGPYQIRAAWDYFVQHLLGEPLPEV
jgi:dipeptidyl aminopeptidase/acylaminoacyl peptidase